MPVEPLYRASYHHRWPDHPMLGRAEPATAPLDSPNGRTRTPRGPGRRPIHAAMSFIATT